MALLFKKVNRLIHLLDEYFSLADQSALVFKSGINNYLYDEPDRFQEDIKHIGQLESKADELQRTIETELYVHSLLPQYRGDVLTILEKTDNIINGCKETLYQFDVEIPSIPNELTKNYAQLTELSVLAVEAVIIACRSFFTDLNSVKDKLHRVYFYEREADHFANSIKRRLFHEMDKLKLSEKIHLRYFALHIEQLSDKAQDVADVLSIATIKRSL